MSLVLRDLNANLFQVPGARALLSCRPRPSELELLHTTRMVNVLLRRGPLPAEIERRQDWFCLLRHRVRELRPNVPPWRGLPHLVRAAAYPAGHRESEERVEDQPAHEGGIDSDGAAPMDASCRSGPAHRMGDTPGPADQGLASDRPAK